MDRVLPILFNTDMVRAILDGRKTVTRRVIKPHNARKASEQEYCQGNGLWVDHSTDNGDHEGHIKDYSISPCWISWSRYIQMYAPYRIGDILYVRETWCMNYYHKYGKYFYRADGEEIEIPTIYGKKAMFGKAEGLKWRPSIHLPKAAARIWLKVTDVRVERLQDITPDQCIAEGIYEEEIIKTKNSCFKFCGSPKEIFGVDNAFSYCFRKCWNSTIKKSDIGLYGWDANPWVWVIEFLRCEKPEGGKLCQKSI